MMMRNPQMMGGIRMMAPQNRTAGIRSVVPQPPMPMASQLVPKGKVPFVNPRSFVPGGEVSDPYANGRRDTVPAFVDDGEFILNRDAVRGIGGGDTQAGIKLLYNLQNRFSRLGKQGR